MRENKRSSFFRPVTDWCTHRAVFFNSVGGFVGMKKLDYKEELFEFKGRVYHFLPRVGSSFKYRTFMSTQKFYFYDLAHPDPYLLDTEKQPFIDSRVYKAVTDNKLIKDLNDLANKSFLDKLLDPKVLIPLVIFIGAIYYFSTGGSLT